MAGTILIPSLIEGGFALGSKLIGNMGKNKQAAAMLLRVQESDLNGISNMLKAMIDGEGPIDKNMLSIVVMLIERAAFISDKAADSLVGDNDNGN